MPIVSASYSVAAKVGGLSKWWVNVASVVSAAPARRQMKS